jgi:hypothetical protein
MNEEQKTASEEAAAMIQSPLFNQIACMMAACTAAKILVDTTATYNGLKRALTESETRELNNAVSNLAQQLKDIDFENGREIVAGAMQACQLAQSNVDIVCSGFTVGMPQKSKNPEKLMFIKGTIGADKACIIFMNQESGEQCIKGLTGCLDILYPQRLIATHAPRLVL